MSSAGALQQLCSLQHAISPSQHLFFSESGLSLLKMLSGRQQQKEMSPILSEETRRWIFTGEGEDVPQLLTLAKSSQDSEFYEAMNQ